MKISNTNSLENKILQDIYSSVLVLDSKGMIQYINAHASRLLEISDKIEPGTVHFTAKMPIHIMINSVSIFLMLFTKRKRNT